MNIPIPGTEHLFNKPQLELPLYQAVDVDGFVDEKRNIRYFGKATCPNNDGKWVCLADVGGCLCVIEVRLRFQS